MGMDSITGEEFVELMRQVGLEPGSKTVAVGVSGGADSMALALLAAEWGSVRAVTFDHGLRPGSDKEAERVGKWLDARDIAHAVLTHDEKLADSNIQAEAREARYRALEEWCRAEGINDLLVAHHQDDQAETFLLRLARGSGVDGLAAMTKVGALPSGAASPRLLRPLLDIPKGRLEATLRSYRQEWIEDPSNADPKFDRAKIRKLLRKADVEGLNAPRLAATAARMRRARMALESYAGELLAAAVEWRPEGFARLSLPQLMAAPEETGLRVLSRILMIVAGRKYPVREERLERLFASLTGAAAATLGGCQIFSVGPERLIICREPAMIDDSVQLLPGESAVWDARFDVSLSADSVPGKISNVGAEGWRQLVKAEPELKANTLPHPVRLGLPSLWQEGKIVDVPHLDYHKGPEATLRATHRVPGKTAELSARPAAND